MIMLRKSVTIEQVNEDPSTVSLAEYRRLAELRFRIRCFLQYGEQIARLNGIEPQQHQLMITIKGLPSGTIPTVSALANRLCLRHHSTVELINRLVERGAAVRKPSLQDRRQVLVELTPAGEELLQKLGSYHEHELQTCAPELLSVITQVLNAPASALAEAADVDEVYSDIASSECIPALEPDLAIAETDTVAANS